MADDYDDPFSAFSGVAVDVVVAGNSPASGAPPARVGPKRATAAKSEATPPTSAVLAGLEPMGRQREPDDDDRRKKGPRVETREPRTGIRICPSHAALDRLDEHLAQFPFTPLAMARQGDGQQVQGKSTIGVVVKKSDPKSGSTGKTFGVVSLWDMRGFCEAATQVGVLMVGAAFQNSYLRLSVGDVVVISEFTLLPSKGAEGSAALLRVADVPSVRTLGTAVTLVECKGTTRSAQEPCTNWVNSEMAAYCRFHSSSLQSVARSISTTTAATIKPPTPAARKTVVVLGTTSANSVVTSTGDYAINRGPLVQGTRVQTPGGPLTSMGARQLAAVGKIDRPHEDESNALSKTQAAPAPTFAPLDGRRNPHLSDFALLSNREAFQHGPVVSSRQHGNAFVRAVAARLGTSLTQSQISIASSQGNSDAPVTLMGNLAMGRESKNTELIGVAERARVMTQMEKLATADRAFTLLAGVTEQEVQGCWCNDCSKWYFHRERACVNRGHNTVIKQTTKRFYQCVQCHQKMPILGLSKDVPVVARYCPKCRRDTDWQASNAAPHIADVVVKHPL